MIEKPSAHALEVLQRMVEHGEKVEAKTNAELAQILTELVDDHTIDSYFYLIMMECAYRLAPEIFPPDDEKEIAV